MLAKFERKKLAHWAKIYRQGCQKLHSMWPEGQFDEKQFFFEKNYWLLTEKFLDFQ